MKTTRIKIPLPTLATRDDAEACMTELAQTLNNLRKITAVRDAAVLQINKRFEADLAACDQAIQLKTESLRAWAEANPDQFPTGRKSLPLTSGLIGFRTGTPKLTLVSRAWTWDKVLTAILERAWAFVRTKQEVDKEALLAFVSAGPEPAAELEAAILRPLGVKIVQEESFFIEPALTELPTRQTPEAA